MKIKDLTNNELHLTYSVPFLIFLGLTYDCNYSCKHCYAKKNKNSQRRILEFNDFVELINSLEKIGSILINYSHGETLLYKNALEIFKLAKKKGFFQTLITNGSLINSTEQINNLHKSGINSILISLDSPTSEKHNKNRGSSKAFLKAVNCLDMLSCSTIPIKGIAHTLNNFNSILDIEKIIQIAIEKNLDYISLMSMRNKAEPKIKDIVNNSDYLLSLWDLILRYQKKILISTHEPLLIKLLENTNFETEKELLAFLDNNSCHAGESILSIDCYGDIRACNFVSKVYGNIFENDIFSIWDNIQTEYKNPKKSFSMDCLNCNVLQFCRGGCKHFFPTDHYCDIH